MAPGGQHAGPLSEESQAAVVTALEAVSASIVTRFGWRWTWGPTVALADLSGKVGTAMQLGSVVAARQSHHVRFTQKALEVTDPDVPLAEEQLSSLWCFTRMWSLLRWKDGHKEAWWRLGVDGIPLLEIPVCQGRGWG